MSHFFFTNTELEAAQGLANLSAESSSSNNANVTSSDIDEALETDVINSNENIISPNNEESRDTDVINDQSGDNMSSCSWETMSSDDETSGCYFVARITFLYLLINIYSSS